MYGYTPDQVLHMPRRHFLMLYCYIDNFLLLNARLTAIAFNEPNRLFDGGGSDEANDGRSVQKVNTDNAAEVAQVLSAING